MPQTPYRDHPALKRAAPEPEFTHKTVRVYVCPTPHCGDYFGTGTMEDLTKIFTGPKTEDKPNLLEKTGSDARHTRAACPSCRVRGTHVERILMETVLRVPVAGPPTPELPRHS